MLRSPVSWLMFAMMAMMSTSGLMVTSQIGVFAADFGVAKVLVWGMAALPLALTIDRFCNGLTRPFFGWVSDRIGRENTMAAAFVLEGLAMLAWLGLRQDPVLFVLLSDVVFFAWGEIFSLFPSTLTDTFGTRWATRNYGCLYMGCCCTDPPVGVGSRPDIRRLPPDLTLDARIAVQAEPGPSPPYPQAEAQGHELARV